MKANTHMIMLIMIVSLSYLSCSVEDDSIRINSIRIDKAKSDNKNCTICHFNKKDDTFNKLEIDCNNSLNVHLQHGDFLPGDIISASPNFLDENCNLVLLESCPCFMIDDLLSIPENEVQYFYVCKYDDNVILRKRTVLAYQQFDVAYDRYSYTCFFNGFEISNSQEEAEACANVILESARLLNIPIFEECE